eukprot:s841_g13.t2
MFKPPVSAAWSPFRKIVSPRAKRGESSAAARGSKSRRCAVAQHHGLRVQEEKHLKNGKLSFFRIFHWLNCAATLGFSHPLRAMFRSSCLLVRKMFLPFYSKEGGPPKIRQQVVGTKGRRFFKLVACNQKDKQNGKHMEVLGSYAPKARSNVKELRLRFSRVKFALPGLPSRFQIIFRPGDVSWEAFRSAIAARFAPRKPGSRNMNRKCTWRLSGNKNGDGLISVEEFSVMGLLQTKEKPMTLEEEEWVRNIFIQRFQQDINANLQPVAYADYRDYLVKFVNSMDPGDLEA